MLHERKMLMTRFQIHAVPTLYFHQALKVEDFELDSSLNSVEVLVMKKKKMILKKNKTREHLSPPWQTLVSVLPRLTRWVLLLGPFLAKEIGSGSKDSPLLHFTNLLPPGNACYSDLDPAHILSSPCDSLCCSRD